MTHSSIQTSKSKFVHITSCRSLDKVAAQNEESIEIWYQFALDKPKPTHSIPQEEWISTIKSLSHILNEKAKTYVVGFFNGDIKAFNKKDHSEILNVKQLHQESIITDALFLKNDALNKKLLITCSALPNSELKISEISQEGKKYHFTQLATSKDELNGINDGFKCLASSPINNEYICSAFQTSEGAPEKALLIWRLDARSLEDAVVGFAKKGMLKR